LPELHHPAGRAFFVICVRKNVRVVVGNTVDSYRRRANNTYRRRALTGLRRKDYNELSFGNAVDFCGGEKTNYTSQDLTPGEAGR
jgi:hypothetical protein